MWDVDFSLTVTDKVCAEAVEYQSKNGGELVRDVYAGFWRRQPDVAALIPVMSRPLRAGEENLIKEWPPEL